MMFRALATLSLLLSGRVAAQHMQVHDASFQPDYILVASAGNITINCESRYSVTINGTFPGPTIYFEENKTTWIRVWNHIPDRNLTMVSFRSTSIASGRFGSNVSRRASTANSCFVALAWSQSTHRAVQRWNSSGQPVANCAESLLRL